MLLDGLIRNAWVLAFVAAVGLWEAIAPRHRRIAGRSLRWPTSFALGPVNALLATVPLAPLALATTLTGRWDTLAIGGALGWWIAIALSVLALDLAFYTQHRVLHAVPWLWSVHRVHHTDVDVDYTTAFRFHPIEAVITNATALACVAAFGIPPLAVVIHQALAGGLTVIEHANARVPAALEAWAGRVLVTPGLHRIHHSTAPHKTDSNFATIFSFWDRWLGTYAAPASAGREDGFFGLREFRERKYLTLPWTLALPFLRLRRAHQPPLP
jgi:sterol desaturase/sphingolipid hydroxylase (fatty acid hydroxylase superfamily)